MALSVLMTMSTTLLCIVATPLIAWPLVKVLDLFFLIGKSLEAKAQCILGTVVSVDAVGIIISTMKVVC